MSEEQKQFSKEAEEAAKQYATLCREIASRSKTLGGGALARVIKAYAKFPFAAEEPKFRSRAESDLFLLMLSNDKAKKVISNELASEAATLEKAAVGNVTEEILNDLKPKGETNNGKEMDESRNDSGN